MDFLGFGSSLNVKRGCAHPRGRGFIGDLFSDKGLPVLTFLRNWRRGAVEDVNNLRVWLDM